MADRPAPLPAVGMNRHARRADEAAYRKVLDRAASEAHSRLRSGQWPPWERTAVSPGEVGGRGWTRDIHTAWHNGLLAVLVRTVPTEWGDVEHAAIRDARGGDVPWRTKQRVKDELFGPHRVAVEAFPAAGSLVDGANMYHIWVLPEGFRLPFTINEGDEP